MPAATTHVEFAKDVYRSLDPMLQDMISNRNMFLLGSQGPDVLFFSRASLLPGSLKSYGNLMHDTGVAGTIAYFDRYGMKDDDLRSYCLGFLCHYALDSIAHPLICAVARRKHEETGIHEGEAHVTMEGDIDAWILNRKNRDIWSYDVYEDLKVDRASARKLANLYHGMFRSVYHEEVPTGRLLETITQMSFWTRFLKPGKAKQDLISRTEDLLKMPHSFSGMMLYGHDDRTVINEAHHSYPLVFDPSRTISASFPELYEQALERARQLLASHDADDFRLNFTGEPY